MSGTGLFAFKGQTLGQHLDGFYYPALAGGFFLCAFDPFNILLLVRV
jgi:hypothetical protein